MRLTNNLIIKRYVSNLSDSAGKLNELNEKSITQKNFIKASEDPTAAVKALKVRKDLSKISLYQSSLTELEAITTETEAAISSLKDILDDANTLVAQGKSGTYDADAKKTVAYSLRSIQKQILDIGNKQVAGKYLFNGSGKGAPFSVAGDRLLYRGKDMDSGVFSADRVLVDIGLGSFFDSTHTINPNGAFDISQPGNELLGSGADADGITNNLYHLIGQMAEMFENNNMTSIETYAEKLTEKTNDVIVMYANIGDKCSMLEYLQKKLDISEDNRKAMQDSIEKADLTQTIMLYKSQEASYNAALQIGSKILQMSLMDYLK